MIMLFRFFLFVLFCFVSTCFGQVRNVLSQEESVVLRQFFQTLVEKSEGGYVFFGKKPVCIHGYFYKDVFIPDSPVHKQSVALREGARIWKQFSEKTSDIVVHVCEKEDPNIRGHIHVLVINKPLLQKVISENISLFQYVLGPSVTPQNLLDAFIAKQSTYNDLLKGDKVLTGIILGFGVQNALYGSRLENIQEAGEDTVPPFVSSRLLVKEYMHEYLPLRPSFGFDSSQQEYQHLDNQIQISSKKLLTKDPVFFFGCVKGASKALLAKGAKIAEHLQKCRAVNVDQIISYLEQLVSGGEDFVSTTQEEQDLINKVHWKIYYGSSEWLKFSK